jgi:uncharacterized protein involved in outer membrane biogenesis
VKIRNIIAIACLTGLTLVIAFYLSLNVILKVAIEQTFTKSLGVETKVSEVTFNPLNGYIKLNRFEISNPKGFSTPKFLQIQDFVIQIKPNSLLGDRIEIERIQIKDISIDIEQQLSRNNIQEIFTSAAAHKQDSQTGKEKKFNLNSATIDNILVNLKLVQLGIPLASTMNSLPRVELQNLNSENYEALIMSEVFTKLVGSLFKNMVEQNKTNIPKQILDMLNR